MQPVVPFPGPRQIRLDEDCNVIRVIQIPVPVQFLPDRTDFIGPGPSVPDEDTEEMLQQIQNRVLAPLVTFYTNYFVSTQGATPQIDEWGQLHLWESNDINNIFDSHGLYRFYSTPRLPGVADFLPIAPLPLGQNLIMPLSPPVPPAPPTSLASSPATSSRSSSRSSDESPSDGNLFGKITYKQTDSLYKKYKKLYKALNSIV